MRASLGLFSATLGGRRLRSGRPTSGSTDWSGLGEVQDIDVALSPGLRRVQITFSGGVRGRPMALDLREQIFAFDEDITVPEQLANTRERNVWPRWEAFRDQGLEEGWLIDHFPELPGEVWSPLPPESGSAD